MLPPPPLKLRLLLLLPVIPAILAVLLLAMLIVDKPILFVDRPPLKIYYAGGIIGVASITPDVWKGPSTEAVNGAYGPEYKYFREKQDWENALPRVDFQHIGISYSSRPRAQDKGSTFVADRWRALSIRAEYFIAL